jgi:hypothetical protein
MSNPIHNIEGNWEITLAGDGDTSAVCTLHKPAIFIYHRKRTMPKFSSVLLIASVSSILSPSFTPAQFVECRRKGEVERSSPQSSLCPSSQYSR